MQKCVYICRDLWWYIGQQFQRRLYKVQRNPSFTFYSLTRYQNYPIQPLSLFTFITAQNNKALKRKVSMYCRYLFFLSIWSVIRAPKQDIMIQESELLQENASHLAFHSVSSVLQCNGTLANKGIINVAILRGMFNWSETVVSETCLLWITTQLGTVLKESRWLRKRYEAVPSPKHWDSCNF